MRDRFSRTLNVLLGRDKETPAERAFRHERERGLFSITCYFLSGLCMAIAINLALTGTFVWLTQLLVLSFIALIIVLIGFNYVLKRHQNKSGGD
jgi:hypothetical protein